MLQNKEDDMTMKCGQATVAQWGQSAALRIPSDVLHASGLHIGQQVEFESTDTGVIIVRPIRQRPKLDELLDKITPNNLPEMADIEWGQPKGSEEW